MSETLCALWSMVRCAAACIIALIAMLFGIPGRLMVDIGEWLIIAADTIHAEPVAVQRGKFERKEKPKEG